MRVAFSKPAPGHQYLVGKKPAVRLVRSLLPELELLAFQTRRGPKMTKGVPYCAVYEHSALRVLSVEERFATGAAADAFERLALPAILKRIQDFRAREYTWPCVAVALEGRLLEVTCSDGGLFPSLDEVREGARRSPGMICDWPATNGAG